MQDHSLDHGWLISQDGGLPSAPSPSAVPAAVPGVLQETFPEEHGIVWYWLSLTLDEIPPSARRILHFARARYAVTVWLNGRLIGAHEGDGEFAFELDAPAGSHLLAVRLLDPAAERIDGIVLSEVPSSNMSLAEQYTPGRQYSYGGLIGPVSLLVRPRTDFEDVHVQTDLATGRVTVEVTVVGGDAPVGVVVRRGELIVATQSQQVIGRDILIVDVPDPVPWSLDNPQLYDVDVSLPGSARRIKTGFRDFRVGPDGLFRLNGRPLFIRSTHTGNHVPQGIGHAAQQALLRRDLVNAKAAGLNMVRFIAGPADPSQLDLCDELGLLVYEETLAAWLLGESPHLGRRFDTELRAMLRRDRNHPSVVAWGLLNETFDGPVFRHAVGALDLVRDLDDGRLVLLSSGRWDGDAGIGSYANPGERTWQRGWADEAPGANPVQVAINTENRGGYVERVGDRHLYPRFPPDAATESLLRTMGAPVFLSEYGVGSLFDVVKELRALTGTATGLAEQALMRVMEEQYLADWNRYGLGVVYAFPEDLLGDSQTASSRARLHGLNLIRSNPGIVGYNLTGMLDHAVCGEGLWTFDRRFKAGVLDALADGLAPLRWCVFVTPQRAYPGVSARVEIVLANDGVLAPGSYRAHARLTRTGGIVWEREFSVDVPAEPRLAFPVLTDDVPLAEAGTYRLAVSLLDGGVALGGRVALRRWAPQAVSGVRVRVRCAGVEPAIVGWLRDYGVEVEKFDPATPEGPPVLIDCPDDSDLRALRELVDGGGSVAVLSPASLAEFGLPIEVVDFKNWLYHMECVALPHPLFTGLAAPGIVDWEDFGNVFPHRYLSTAEIPIEAAAVNLTVGYPVRGGYASGYVAGTWRCGLGTVFAVTFDILAHVRSDPVAGGLLLNTVRQLASQP